MSIKSRPVAWDMGWMGTGRRGDSVHRQLAGTGRDDKCTFGSDGKAQNDDT